MKALKIVQAAVVATAAMTGFILIAPYVGLPEMNVGTLLGSMLGGSQVLGWFAHAGIGILFAFVYEQFVNGWVPIRNKISRGAVYGIIVFFFSEIIFMIINLLGYFNYDLKESMSLMIFGNMLACLIYGAVLGTFFVQSEGARFWVLGKA